MMRGADSAPLSVKEAVAPTEAAVAASSGSAADARPHRPVSADTAAKLTAAVPPFTAPAPAAEPASSPAVEPANPVAGTDKPKNQIIRLPTFRVGEPKLPVPKSELEVLTPKGRVELAMARRPGLKFGPLAFLNQGVALAMLEEDLAVERRRQMAELMSLYAIREQPGK